MKPDVQENLMSRYLLGELAESEVDLLEQKILTDDEKFEQLWEIENNLVEGYVRDRLSPVERERFERHYLASPVHRQRLAVARNLMEKADAVRATAPANESKVSLLARWFEKLGLSPVAWQFALTAATLLFAAISLWLFLDRTRLRNEMTQLRAESEARLQREQEFAQQIAAARDESKKLTSEIERLRAQQDALSQPEPAQTLTDETPRPAVFSFVLSPMLVRGSDAPQVLTIPHKADTVRLQIKVDKQESRPLQVSVHREGQQVWTQQRIKPHTNGARSALLTANIPASRLPLGDYILTLSAVKATGEPEMVNRYYFRVLRQ